MSETDAEPVREDYTGNESVPPGEATTLEEIRDEAAGARARTLAVARRGLPPTHHQISNRNRDVAQYRAALALMWDRDRILLETGWAPQKLSAIEDVARAEAKRLVEDLDPRVVFAEYKIQQLQAAAELENLAVSFRNSSQHNALVAAVKARSDILDRILKVGQDLGLISRAAREVSVTAKIDLRQLSVAELRIELARTTRDLRTLLEPPSEEVEGIAGTVLRKVLTPPSPPETPTAPAAPTGTPRVKRIRPGS